jgi:hypothetical protein
MQKPLAQSREPIREAHLRNRLLASRIFALVAATVLRHGLFRLSFRFLPMTPTRRQFLKTSLAASAATTLIGARASAAEKSPTFGNREFSELRAYRLKAGASSALLEAYLEKALIPALNKHGVRAVGVFTEMEPKAGDLPTVWVLMPHATLEGATSLAASINTDPEVQQLGAAYLQPTSRATSILERYDSWLHVAFTGHPRLAVPHLKTEGKARIFEMRTYQSYSELKALKKIDMFNAGEIEVMQQLDLSPVFYGQALTGRDLPHLTYMLCSADREAHKKNWDAFLAHPAWVKLKNDPQYADTVSKVDSRFLTPTSYSQI